MYLYQSIAKLASELPGSGPRSICEAKKVHSYRSCFALMVYFSTWRVPFYTDTSITKQDSAPLADAQDQILEAVL